MTDINEVDEHAATSRALLALHRELSRRLTKVLQDEQATLSASLVQEIRMFLTENNVDLESIKFAQQGTGFTEIELDVFDDEGAVSH